MRKNIRYSDLQKLITRSQENAIRYAFAILCSVMRDKEGYGRKRLRRVLHNANLLMASVEEGYVSLQDLVDEIENATGISLLPKGDSNENTKTG